MHSLSCMGAWGEGWHLLTPPLALLRCALCLGCPPGCLSHDPVCLLCSVGMGRGKRVLWIEQLALGWAGQGASGEGLTTWQGLGARVKRGYAGEKVYKVHKDGKEVEVLESDYTSDMNGTETGERRGGKLREATERFSFDWGEAPHTIEESFNRILSCDDVKGKAWEKYQELLRAARVLTSHWANVYTEGCGKPPSGSELAHREISRPCTSARRVTVHCSAVATRGSCWCRSATADTSGWHPDCHSVAWDAIQNAAWLFRSAPVHGQRAVWRDGAAEPAAEQSLKPLGTYQPRA